MYILHKIYLSKYNKYKSVKNWHYSVPFYGKFLNLYGILSFLPMATEDSKSIQRRLDSLVKENHELKAALIQAGINKSLYQTLINSSSETIVITDISGKIQFVSSGAFRVFGYTDESEYINHSVLEFLDTSYHPTAIENLKKLAGGIKLESTQYVAYKKNGERIQIQINSEAILGEKNDPVSFMLVISDISSLKKAEAEISKQQNLYQLTLDNLLEGCQILDFSWNYRYLNDTAAQHGRKSKDELINNSIFNCYPGIESTQLFETLEECMINRTTKSFENEFAYPDGQKAWFELRVHPVPEGLFVLSIDITDRKESETKLKELNKNLLRAQQLAKIGNWEKLLPEKQTHCSETMFEVLGLEPQTKIEQNQIDSLFPPEELSRYTKSIEAAIKNNTPYSEDYKIIRPDGSVRYIHDEGEVIRNKKGVPISFNGTSQDITERKLFEFELQEREQKINHQNNRLNVMVKAIPDLLFIIDKEGNLKEYHAVSKSELLIPPDKIIGENLRNLFDKETSDLHMSKINECLLSKKLVTYDYSVEMRGVLRYYEARFAPLSKTEVLAVIRDITKTKRAEIKLNQSEDNFKRLIHESPYGIRIIATNGKTIYANPMLLKTFGFTGTEDFNKIPATDWYTPECYQEYLIREEKRKKGEKVERNYKVTIINRNGRIKHLLVFRTKILWNGEICDQAIYNDITETESAQIQVSKLSQAVEQSPNSIMITDLDGKIEYVNKSFYETTGFHKNEVIGKSPNILKSGKMPETMYKEMWQTIKAGKIWANEIINKKKNGELFWEQVSITPITNEKGTVTNYLGIKKDVSEKKDFEQRILELNANLEKEIIETTQAKEKAEESDRLKSAFLANMSHEIRTPLNAILGFTQLLISDEDITSDKKTEYSQLINRSADNLLNVINDILDISKLETGQLLITKSTFNPADVLNKLFIIYEKKLLDTNKKDVKLKLIKDNCPKNIHSDRTRLYQIINNLLDNALKFTEKGQISFGILDTTKSHVSFFVSDTGKGVTKEALPFIFDRFRQAEDSLTRQYSGTGLGLSIVKNLVELMNGELGIESEIDKGTTIKFSIPIH